MKLDIKGKISGFVGDSKRILRLTKKPDKSEFFLVAKITGLGILLLGLIGYVIETIKYLIAG
jgi:protein transport protein SEC61 subunit gamma-like protein